MYIDFFTFFMPPAAQKHRALFFPVVTPLVTTFSILDECKFIVCRVEHYVVIFLRRTVHNEQWYSTNTSKIFRTTVPIIVGQLRPLDNEFIGNRINKFSRQRKR